MQYTSKLAAARAALEMAEKTIAFIQNATDLQYLQAEINRIYPGSGIVVADLMANVDYPVYVYVNWDQLDVDDEIVAIQVTNEYGVFVENVVPAIEAGEHDIYAVPAILITVVKTPPIRPQNGTALDLEALDEILAEMTVTA